MKKSLSMDDLTMAHYEKAARALGYEEFRDPGGGWATFARPQDDYKSAIKAADWAELCAEVEIMPEEWNGKQGYEADDSNKPPAASPAEATLRHHANETLEESEFLLRNTIPLKPAPDAIREKILSAKNKKITDDDREYASELLTELKNGDEPPLLVASQWFRKARIETELALSAPVPPPDGAAEASSGAGETDEFGYFELGRSFYEEFTKLSNDGNFKGFICGCSPVEILVHLINERDEARAAPSPSDDVRSALANLVKYCEFQIKESSYHPTLPSAVARANAALRSLTGAKPVGEGNSNG